MGKIPTPTTLNNSDTQCYEQKPSRSRMPKGVKSNWDRKMAAKNLERQIKLRQQEIRDKLTEEKTLAIQQRKEREERRKANEKKAEVVQVIRDTKKLKRMKKKDLKRVEKRDFQ